MSWHRRHVLVELHSILVARALSSLRRLPSPWCRTSNHTPHTRRVPCGGLVVLVGLYGADAEDMPLLALGLAYELLGCDTDCAGTLLLLPVRRAAGEACLNAAERLCVRPS